MSEQKTPISVIIQDNDKVLTLRKRDKLKKTVRLLSKDDNKIDEKQFVPENYIVQIMKRTEPTEKSNGEITVLVTKNPTILDKEDRKREMKAKLLLMKNKRTNRFNKDINRMKSTTSGKLVESFKAAIRSTKNPEQLVPPDEIASDIESYRKKMESFIKYRNFLGSYVNQGMTNEEVQYHEDLCEHFKIDQNLELSLDEKKELFGDNPDLKDKLDKIKNINLVSQEQKDLYELEENKDHVVVEENDV